MDLSYLEDHRVNSGIAGNLCLLSYVTVDTAARTVLKLGKGTLLAKVDICNAYRNISVHPDDWWLLGVSWNGNVYIGTILSFGLWSTPKIFNSVAYALDWVVRSSGVQHVCHYLDDFMIAGAPGSTQCAADLSSLLPMPPVAGLPSCS